MNKAIELCCSKLKSRFNYAPAAILVLLGFAFYVDSNKWFANILYLTCLVPGLVFLYKQTGALKQFKSFFLSLFLYCLYLSVVLALDGYGPEHIKYYLLLVLFFYFVCFGGAAFYHGFRVYIVMLVFCTVVITYALLTSDISVGGSYDFSGLNANRVSWLIILPAAWFLWYSFEKAKPYRYVAVFLLVFSFISDFYLLGSRTFLLFMMVYALFFIYEFRRRFTLDDFKCFSIIALALIFLVFLFHEFLYHRIALRGGSYRLDIWLDMLNRVTVEQCYIFGCGKVSEYRFLGAFDNPHGVYASTLYYYGAVGLLALFLFLYVCYSQLRGFYRAWFVACLFCFIFTHVEIVESPSILWLYFWMPLFIGILDKRGFVNA